MHKNESRKQEMFIVKKHVFLNYGFYGDKCFPFGCKYGTIACYGRYPKGRQLRKSKLPSRQPLEERR